MREKIYEIPIDHPLTPARRKTIDKYIARNAHLAPPKVDVSHGWEEEVLRISTPPVAWEILFNSKNVEIFGTAPFWARLLFTKEKRMQLKAQIELLLHETGFVAAKPVGAKAASAGRKPK